MNWDNVVTVYLKELKDALRDRRTLFSTFVIPALVMPLFTLGIGSVAKNVMTKAYEESSTIAVLGGEDSPEVLASLRASKRFKIVATPADLTQQIANKKIRAGIKFPAGFEAGLKTSAAPAVTLYHYEGEVKSSVARGELEKFLRDLRDRTVAERLAEKSLPATLIKPFEIKNENVASSEEVGGNRVGGFVPYLIIIICLTGAAVPATDLTAGEKERGTMETLLCSPAARLDIVLGKFFVVLTGSLSAMGCMLFSMAATAFVAGTLLADPQKIAQTAAQAKQAAGLLPTIDLLGIVGVLAMVLPVAVLFSAVTFAIGLFAKSAKEAQSYLAPLMFVVLMPAVIGILPGIELDARLALVPLLNLSLVCREMLSGVWHWNYIALIFGSSCVYATGALALAVKMFNREDVIFRT